jgi:KEOPS complex subunit Cgi121
MDTSGNSNRPDIIRDREIDDPGFEISQVCFQVREIGGFLTWLRDVSNRNGVSIVCFNADLMAGKPHVISAMLHALRAMRNGTCISSSFEIEALLYASGSRQCQEGVKFGVRQGMNRCYLCVYPVNPQVWPELSGEMTFSSDDWEPITDEKMEVLVPLFGITNKEVEVTGKNRIRDLVLERVALLDVNK